MGQRVLFLGWLNEDSEKAAIAVFEVSMVQGTEESLEHLTASIACCSNGSVTFV